MAEPLSREERADLLAAADGWEDGQPDAAASRISAGQTWRRYEATVKRAEAALLEIEEKDSGITIGSGESAYVHECPGRALARAYFEEARN